MEKDVVTPGTETQEASQDCAQAVSQEDCAPDVATAVFPDQPQDVQSQDVQPDEQSDDQSAIRPDVRQDIPWGLPPEFPIDPFAGDFTGQCGGRFTSEGRKWTFACVTFGCKVNQYETQAIREAWTAAGGWEVDNPAQAELILVNSCAITGKAERDARNALVRLRREACWAVLVLTGCAARLVAGFVPRKDAQKPEADCIVVQEEKQALCDPLVIEDLVHRIYRPEGAESSPSSASAPSAAQQVPAAHWKDLRDRAYPDLRITTYRRVRPVLKVQDGCSHRCTYCIVPSTRGPHVSRDPAAVLAEADRLLEQHAELMISGVNLGQYGRDNPSCGSFWTLLDRLEDALGLKYAGRRRLRISSLEPSQLTEEGCRILSRSQLVAPHLHISLQHASRAVLRRMGRGHYTAETLTEALYRLKDAWPDMGLGADILVGFPGETWEDIDILCRFIENTPFTYAHVFPYSRRPGTPAASFSDQIPRREKAERAARVRSVVAQKARAFWKRRVQDEPDLFLAADAGEGHILKGYIHAVDACYTPCFIPCEELEAAQERVEGAGHSEFVRARPVQTCSHGVVVELVPTR